jgi:hypothetical protein
LFRHDHLRSGTELVALYDRASELPGSAQEPSLIAREGSKLL